MVEHTMADLLAFGLAYEEHLRMVVGERGSLHLPTETLAQYLRAANQLFAAKVKQAQPSGGRPPGSSMGAQVARFVANGMPEDAAAKIVAKQEGKPVEAARRSYQAARKKPP
jgi:hypothetical protein